MVATERMRSLRPAPLAALVAASVVVSGCAHTGPVMPARHDAGSRPGVTAPRPLLARRSRPVGPASRAGAAAIARWTIRTRVRGVVDLSAPRADGSILVAARGRLQTLSAAGALTPFAPSYSAPTGLEPYVVLSSGERVADAAC